RREDRPDAPAHEHQRADAGRVHARARPADAMRLRAAIAGLALAGAAVAGYLVYARYTHTQLACTTGGCETVQHSKYAKAAGIPVALLGLAADPAGFVPALSASAAAAPLD